MDDGEGRKKGFIQNVMDTFRDDNTSAATGNTVKRNSNENARDNLSNGEQQAAKDTAPGGDYGGADGASSAAKANAAEGAVKPNILDRAKQWAVDVGNDKHALTKDRRGRGGMVRKFSPVLFILMALMTYGTSSFLGQLAMPISLISQFQGNFNSIGVSNFLRSTRMTRWALHPGTRYVSDEANKFVRQHSKIYQIVTGASDEKYFKITPRQEAKLGKKNIEVVDDAVAGKIMVYTKKDIDGNVIGRYEIVADPSQATGGRVLLDDLYETDLDFRQHYHEGTRSWRQAVFDWFDNLSVRFLKKIDVYRNRFKDFLAKVFGNTEDYEGTVKSAVGGENYTGRAGKDGVEIKDEEVEQEGGGKKTQEVHRRVEAEDTDLSLKRGMDYEAVSKSLSKFTEGVGGKVSKIAKEVANGVCTVSEIIGAINMLVIAMESMQIIRVASTIFEGIQKGQVADSNESPINDIANSLTKRKKTKYRTKDFHTSGEFKEKNGSAMEANAISAMYGNFPVNATDYSVNSFNLTDSLNDIMAAFGANMTAYKSCTIAKLGASLIEIGLDTIDVITDVLAVVACIGGAAFSGGASCAGVIGKIVGKVAAGMAFTALISTIVGHVVNILVPKVATMLARDLATDIGGEDFGNALVSGANMYMGQNHQYGGGAVASPTSLMTFLVQKEAFIADEARYQRETRSPFDASSPYTFMGSLLSKSVPILTQSGSLLSGITNVTKVVGDSLISLVPTSHAAVTASDFISKTAEHTDETCPELSAIGAVGDAFCNPLFITDIRTMDLDPAEVAYRASEYGKNFILDNSDTASADTDSGTVLADAKLAATSGADNLVVNTDIEDSRLMRYIVFCGQRSSGFGMADQNIANAINDGAGSIESSVPIWGGIADFLQNGDLLRHIGYISGEACVVEDNKEDMGSQVFSWREASIYQRWIEDQRYSESVGLIDKSAVAVALDKYYEEHPIDDSFEGILAMKSGMTKERVVDTIAMLQGFMWLAGYDPSDMYPYSTPEEEPTEIAIEDYDIVETVEDVLPQKNNYEYIFRNEFSIS